MISTARFLGAPVIEPPGDEGAISQAIQDLSRDAEHRRTMGRAARAEIERAYGLEICARAYDDIYQLVMATGPER